MDKDRMIEAYERGWTTYYGMVDYYFDNARSSADSRRKRERENPPPKQEEGEDRS